jgi:hypothetical protein
MSVCVGIDVHRRGRRWQWWGQAGEALATGSEDRQLSPSPVIARPVHTNVWIGVASRPCIEHLG